MDDDTKPVVFFDGVCNLCTRTVQFILKRDKKKQFLFASLQGKAGQDLLRKYQLPTDNFNSFLLVEGDKIYKRSTAVLRLLRKLGGIYSVAYAFMLIPRTVRDGLYNWIARNRYRWFGKKEECWLPTPDLQSRFLD